MTRKRQKLWRTKFLILFFLAKLWRKHIFSYFVHSKMWNLHSFFEKIRRFDHKFFDFKLWRKQEIFKTMKKTNKTNKNYEENNKKKLWRKYIFTLTLTEKNFDPTAIPSFWRKTMKKIYINPNSNQKTLSFCYFLHSFFRKKVRWVSDHQFFFIWKTRKNIQFKM